MNTQTESFAPGFMVIHGNRLEDLRHLLIQVIKAYRLPVLSPEIILVQNNGMKHWLEMSLASDDVFGICAATRIELPSSYLWSIYRTILSDIQIPVHMPFDKKNLTWRLYKILPSLIDKEAFSPLKRYLGDVIDSRRLYQLAGQIADVFDGYQNYRADWLMDWASGRDQLISDSYLKNPSKPILLAPDELWQSELWRALRMDIGEELADASRASVHAQFLKKMDSVVNEFKRTKKKPVGVPSRVVIFGISSLPPQVIEAFAKLGQICQVFMFVQNPCQTYWGDIVDGHELLRSLNKRRQSARISDMHMSSHPLLASWGKQGRDYFHLLDDFDNLEDYRGDLEKALSRVDVFVDPLSANENTASESSTSSNQLRSVQSFILNLTPIPEEMNKLEKEADDQSIEFVSAHSAQREVEILHDQLHAWFDHDSSLAPENVMVMVPDMETFLPRIRAVFGRFKLGDERYIPFSVADVTSKESPVVRALTQLLATPTNKISVLDWMDLFEVDAVCEKFELSNLEVEQLRAWCLSAGVRWGLDKDHRVQNGVDSELADVDQNTWAFGVKRLLLGYALGHGQSWEGTLACSGVTGLDGPLLSKLLNWLDAIQILNTELSQDHTSGEWVVIFKRLLDTFFKACDDAQERLLIKVFEPLESWERICFECKLDSPISLNVVRDYWLNQLEDIGLQQRFFGGGVQFGTLMPMRSIPFKIICLLGMNDGDFPRQTSSRDFDLMPKHWRTGDRSRREDDRYLFLEALLCARQKLYVSWQGRSARDNSEKPPSVLVSQLIDYLNAVWHSPVKPINHPLQPFSVQYFSGRKDLFTYDKDWEVTQPRGSLQEGSDSIKNLKELTETDNLILESIEVSELHRLLRNPVEIFFRSRLNIYLDKLNDKIQDAEPFSLNNLEEFNIANELLMGNDLEIGLENLSLSGRLPLAAYGVKVKNDLGEKVENVLAQKSDWIDAYPQTSDALVLQVDLGNTVVKGILSNLQSRVNSTTKELEYLQIDQRVGAVSEKKRGLQIARGHIVIKLWVNHLLGCAHGLNLKSLQIGSDAQIIFDALEPTKAQEILRKWILIYSDAWLRPLPVACKTSLAWLHSDLFNQRVKVEEINKELEDPHEIAEEIFDPPSPPKDGPQGERKDSLYLMRAFSGYEDLREDLPDLARSLYSDLIEAASIVKTSIVETRKERE